jgi:NTE family protein
MNEPDPRLSSSIERSNDELVQAELEGSNFWSWHERMRRVFVVGAGGTSFGGSPLANTQFTLGAPFKLDAFSVGERRGDNYAVVTAGYLHVVSRLPDFLGGPVVAGIWSENGAAFDKLSDAAFETQLGFGVVSETFIGPSFIGYSIGRNARRLFVSFGRVFR